MNEIVSSIEAIWGSIEVLSAVNQAARATDNLLDLTPRDWQEFMYALKRQGFNIVYDINLNKVPAGAAVNVLADAIADKVIQKLQEEKTSDLRGLSLGE